MCFSNVNDDRHNLLISQPWLETIVAFFMFMGCAIKIKGYKDKRLCAISHEN